MFKHKCKIYISVLALSCLMGLSPESAKAQCGNINFKASNPTKSCPLLIVNFNATGTSSAAGTIFQWDFGNGYVKGLDTITKGFSTPGQYTVKMLATLSGANAPCPVIQKDTFITVLPVPVLNVSASTGFTDCNFIKNKKITFTDNTPGIVSRSWTINGFNDTAKSFTDSFQTPANYPIYLKSKNKFNCSNFALDTLHLLDSIPVDICASFTVTKSNTTGTFTPGVGNTHGATITSYKWSFPGGSPSSSNREFPPQVTYPDITKKYDVSLTITSSTGCTYTILRKGFVSPFLTPLFQTVCATGFTVYTDVSDGNRVGYNYNFPNGNFAPLPAGDPNPTYGVLSYNSGGSYGATISYSYNPGLGCLITVDYRTFVTALGPRVGFSSTDNQICNPNDTVHFINSSDTTLAKNVLYTWYFFDSTSKKLLPTNNKIGPTSNYDTSYIPGQKGKFGVSLIARSSNGCYDSVGYPDFIISAKPKADFDSIKNPLYCLGTTASLISKVTPPEGGTVNYKYKWKIYNQASIAPPDSGISANFSYSADSLGTYDVYLAVSNGHCTSDTIKRAFFKFIGDIVKTVKIGSNAGCLNPDYSTTVSVGRQEIYPPGSQTFYHWFLDPNSENNAFIHFDNPDSPSTRVTFTKDGCYPMFVNVTTVTDTDTCMKVYPPNGAGATVCVGPALSFGVGQLTCPGDTVAVTNYSKPGDFGFKWHVIPAGDAVILPSDTSRDISIVFKKDTCYFITLQGSRTVNGTTCSDIDTSYQCFHLPKPGFYTKTPNLYCAPQQTTFFNTTQNYAYASGYIWRFGNGDTLFVADTESVSYVYQKFIKGAYDVSLTALNPYGCDATVTEKNSIDVIGPVPSFTMDKRVGCDTLTVHFTNTSKNVKKFYFLNGDNATTPDSLNLSTHQYTFDTSGINVKDSITFTPQLLSRDDPNGCNPFFQDSVKLYRTPFAGAVTTNVKAGCTPLKVQFSATAQAGNGWRWDFDGDGIIDDSTHQNPYFVYRKPGIYRAMVIITNHGHCPYIVYSDSIIVAPNAVPGFIPSQKTFCGQQEISFQNTSLYTVKYAFNYGDGSPTDSNKMGVHKYYYDTQRDTGFAAYFYPRLIAFNAGGCSDTLIDTLTVYRLPIAGFSYSKPTGCAPLKVSFLDTSKNDFAAEWDFDNDGVFDAFGKSVDWIYPSGLYTVKMRAYNLQGCVDSIIKVNLVVANTTPVADFSVSDSDVCYKDSVKFTNLTVPSDSVVSWSWKFNDPAAPYDTSSVKNPTFVFYQKGWHTVTLKAVDNQGCSSFIAKRAVFVEDTIPPKNTSLLYVSVQDSDGIQVTYSKSNLQHFDAYKINWISNGIPVKTDTVTSIVDTMFSFRDTAIHTSASSYCFSIQTLNQCGRVSFGSFIHCTILLSGTAAAGPANLLNWTAYSGWTTNWYYIYRSDGGAYKKIDSVRGNTFTWTDTSLCDETYSYYVAAKNDSSGFVSNSNRIVLKAKYVHDNSPMNLRYATVLNNSVVKIKWDSSTYKGLVGYQVSKYSSNAGWLNNFAVTKSNSYIDNKALIEDSSYTYTVRTIDKCGYLGPISNDGTSILIKANVANDKVYLKWNSYRNWQAGVQYYQLQVQLKSKKFRNVAKVAGTDTSYVDDSVYKEIDTAYCYRVVAVENGPTQDSSISNLTCAVLPSRIFVPNAFSPNGDSLNDVWKVSALSVYNVVGSTLTQFSAKVYNRWGMLVFESNDIYKGWDGTFKGTKAPADVYIYIVYAEGIDSRFIRLNGNITLIR